MDDRLRQELRAWDRAGLRRTLALAEGMDFCTNDYLGLAGDPRLADAVRDALDEHGTGARAARLLGGHTPAHAEAESVAARWQGTEAALLFPSGYHANLALVATLPGPDDLILSDARNHASLIDGARLSKATLEVFAHGDADDLAGRLAHASSFARRFIVVESVYSTNGAHAPLERYAELAAEHDAWLLVDEAHAAGLYGEDGAGRARDLARTAARTITGGKALGVAGAFVVGSRVTIETLVNRGRSFVFTTAPMPGLAAALAAAIRIVREDAARRARPHAAARRLRDLLRTHGIEAGGESPIVPVLLGTPAAAVEAARRVQAAGYDVRAVRPPTVPDGESGLRVVCRADHDDATLAAVAAEIAAAVEAVGGCTVATPTRVATPLVVVGTDTDVGKTVVSALLVRAAVRRGRDTHYLKPVQTGMESDTEAVRALAGLDEAAAPEPPVHLALPASVDQAADAAARHITPADLLEPTRAHLAGAPDGTWIVETAGGLLVPLDEHTDQADVLRALGAPCVLVARSGLGTLNHTLLTVEAMRRRGLTLRALFLVGPRHEANERTLAGRLGSLPTFALPELAPLDTRALDAWLDAHDLDALWR